MTRFAALAPAELWRQTRGVNVGQLLFVAAFVAAALECQRTIFFIRQTDTRTLALQYFQEHVPSGATVLTQPHSVPIEPTAEVRREAVGRFVPTKTAALQIARGPYPKTAYRLIYLGLGMDADKLYLPYDQLGGNDPLQALRAEHVAFVVLKRYNPADPTTLPFLAALARTRPANSGFFAVSGRRRAD